MWNEKDGKWRLMYLKQPLTGKIHWCDAEAYVKKRFNDKNNEEEITLFNALRWLREHKIDFTYCSSDEDYQMKRGREYRFIFKQKQDAVLFALKWA